MVTLREVRRAAARQEQFRGLQDGLRQIFDCVAEEPVPDKLRSLAAKLDSSLNSGDEIPDRVSRDLAQPREPEGDS
ncbi:MAG: hypothetical protein GEU95_08390 [Rhizobiales bacterium]|nr:hypothetical protein [Hyphomicrobiales bacterium]